MINRKNQEIKDRFYLLDKIWPLSDQSKLLIISCDNRIAWTSDIVESNRVMKSWREGTLRQLKDVKVPTVNYPDYVVSNIERIGLIAHHENRVEYIALDFDDHSTKDGGKNDVHLLTPMKKFFGAEPVCFHTRSGKGIRAFYILENYIKIDFFKKFCDAYMFNKKDGIEIFPKTEKKTGFFIPNEPIDNCDKYISGDWENAVIQLPETPSFKVSTSVCDFLLGTMSPGNRNISLNNAAYAFGANAQKKDVAKRFCERGALICGIPIDEFEKTFESGYKAGNKREDINLSDELPEIIEHNAEKYEKYLVEGLQPGIILPIKKLSEIYQPVQGQLEVLTGMPHHGKSQWVDWRNIEICRNSNHKFCYFSPENNPIELHKDKLNELYLKKSIKNFTKEDHKKASIFLEQHFCWFEPDKDSPNLKYLLTKMTEKIEEKKQITGFIIDPWNMISREIDNFKTFSETEFIKKSLRDLRSFSRKFNLFMTVVAHPSKPVRDKKGEYPRMGLYDISGSAHWNNIADFGLSIWRNSNFKLDKNSPERFICELYVLKVRSKQYGHADMVNLLFAPEYGGYEEYVEKEVVEKDESKTIIRTETKNEYTYKQPSTSISFMTKKGFSN
jgi:hypothetical protein